MDPSSAILIADVVKKDVVYSAECFDQKPMDSNTQLIVEYSVMALEAKYMAPGDWHDTRRHIDGAIDVLNGVLKIGSVAFPPAAPVLLFFAGVGSGIQWLLGKLPDDRPDPVVEKFKELKEAVKNLEDMMNVHFSDMRSFLSEHNFNVNIITQATTLMSYMRRCLECKSEKDVENFKKEYQKNYPLSAVYNMKSLLDNRQTNPLMMAMAAEKTKTKATFDKWKNIFTSILGQYLFIEAFASGLLSPLKPNDFNQERIIQQWQALDKNLEKWEDEFKSDDGYWKELQNDFEKYFEDHANLKKNEKAKEIYDRLMKIWTHDAFYIFVFDETKWETDYAYYCRNEKDQIIGSWHKGRCNAFVYRCRRTGEDARKDYDTAQQKFNEAVSILRWNGNLRNMLIDQLSSKASFSRYGFFCLFGWKCDVQAWYINKGGSGKGPGYLDYMTLKDQSGNKHGDYWFATGLAPT